MKKPRILLADDHAVILEGCRALLEHHYEIVGIQSDGRSLVEAALRLKPQLILLDISMPSLNGLEAARQINAVLPKVKLLFLTVHAEQSYLQAAFEAGASGYVLKSADRDELLGAVQKVLNGELYVPEGLPAELRSSRDSGQLAKSLSLTAREREVLQLIAEGKSGKEIAHTLSISVKTVEYHRQNIKRKLGVSTIAGLTRNAIAGGLVCLALRGQVFPLVPSTFPSTR